MSREWWTKPLFNTALVATLLIGAIGTAISTTLYLSNRFGALEQRMAAFEERLNSQEKIAEIRRQFQEERHAEKAE